MCLSPSAHIQENEKAMRRDGFLDGFLFALQIVLLLTVAVLEGVQFDDAGLPCVLIIVAVVAFGTGWHYGKTNKGVKK